MELYPIDSWKPPEEKKVLIRVTLSESSKIGRAHV